MAQYVCVRIGRTWCQLHPNVTFARIQGQTAIFFQPTTIIYRQENNLFEAAWTVPLCHVLGDVGEARRPTLLQRWRQDIVGPRQKVKNQKLLVRTFSTLWRKGGTYPWASGWHTWPEVMQDKPVPGAAEALRRLDANPQKGNLFGDSRSSAAGAECMLLPSTTLLGAWNVCIAVCRVSRLREHYFIRFLTARGSYEEQLRQQQKNKLIHLIQLQHINQS